MDKIKQFTMREYIVKLGEVKPHKNILDKLNGSGLDYLLQLKTDCRHSCPLINSMVYLYDENTSTFIIGNHRLYIGLEDVFHITGLPIDGEPVATQKLVNPTNELCGDLLGIDLVSAYNSPKKDKFNFKDLQEIVNKYHEGVHEEELQRACRAAALLAIGYGIFQSSGKPFLSGKFLHFVINVEDVRKYAWGAAVWVNLHSSIKAAKAAVQMKDTGSPALYGCILALEAFAFLRVERLIDVVYPGVQLHKQTLGFPILLSLLKQIGGNKMRDTTRHIKESSIVECLQLVTHDSLVWRPYTDVHIPDIYVSNQISIGRSITTAICATYAATHRPHMSHSQLNVVTELRPVVEQLEVGLPEVDVRNRYPSFKAYEQWLKSWNDRNNHIIPQSQPQHIHSPHDFDDDIVQPMPQVRVQSDVRDFDDDILQPTPPVRVQSDVILTMTLCNRRLQYVFNQMCGILMMTLRKRWL